MNLIEKVYDSIVSDDIDTNKESIRLIEHFKTCDQKEKDAINLAFIYLCGWSLRTLIEE